MATIMHAVRTCPECGAALRADAPGALCPACLSRVTFGLASATEETRDADRATPVAKVPDRLRSFGDFELLEEVGRGGMGVVYRARQRSLNRIVAVKMILAGHFAGEKDVRRFRAEAQAAAKLRHPNIVTVFEVGEHDGRPYFSMEFVEGRPLSEAVGTQPWPARRAAECLRTIAAAMHYAHGEGLVHRDLKPANILVDTADAPRITDFGLARQVGGESNLTLTGQTLGSPSYMSPEQAIGKSAQAGPLSDVYSLGAILYHLVTGRPPFQGESLQSILLQVQNAEPVPPRLLNPGVPRDLETICLKCLEKERARRYASAQHLVDDLDCFLADEPILARPVSAPERLWRWCRRRPAVAGLSAALVLLLVVVAIGSSRAAWRIATARDDAVRERDRAERSLVEVELQRAEDLLADGDGSSAIALLARMTRGHPTNPVVASWLVSALLHRQFVLPAAPAISHGLGGVQARFSPDGTRVAAAWLGTNAGVRIWDAAGSTAITARFPTPRGWEFIDFSPDGRRLAVATRPDAVHILDTDKAQRTVPDLKHEGSVLVVRWSKDGERVVTSCRAGYAQVWSARTGEAIGPRLNHTGQVDYAEFSPDGSRVVTASHDGTACLWDSREGRRVAPPLRHESQVWMARFSPDGRWIATASRDGAGRLWDAQSGQPRGSPLRHFDSLQAVEFSPDGRLIATASNDGTARLWSISTSEPLTPPLIHHGAVVSARFSPDGRTLLTASDDGTARLWEVETGAPMMDAIRHGRRVYGAEFSPDGQRVLTASGGGEVQVWRIRSGSGGSAFAHQDVVKAAEFSLDGTRVLTVSDEGARVWDAKTMTALTPLLRVDGALDVAEMSLDQRWIATVGRRGDAAIWDVSTARVVRELVAPGGKAHFACFSPDSRRVLVGQTDTTASIWDVETGRRVAAPLVLERASPSAGQWSPDGRLVAVTTYGLFGCVWDADNGNLVVRFDCPERSHQITSFTPDGAAFVTVSPEGTAVVRDVSSGRARFASLRHEREVKDARFDAAGRRIATASADGTARIWDALTGQPLTRPLKHQGTVRSARFSPDGARLATASMDGTVRLWNAHTGEPLGPPFTHRSGVYSAVFSPDGRRLLTASRDRTARVWDVAELPLPVPSWFADLAESLGRQRLTTLETLEVVPTAEVEKFKRELGQRPSGDAYVQLARRLFE
jgi:WD40 repeat protein/predicted Ser/Thr protein kinase